MTATEKRSRGRPRKSREDLRRDHALSSLANLDVLLMVDSKRKSSGLSVSRTCELIAKEAQAKRAAAPPNVREMLVRKHKYLMDARTLRRCYARADALRREDRYVAQWIEREIERIGPWAKR